MARGRTRARIRRSHLYTFACLRPSTVEGDEPHSIQGPGYSRLVHCNASHLHKKKPLKYSSNYISTTRYNVITFLPKAFFEQFRRVANIYFLVAAICSLFVFSPFTPLSMIAPLAFVLGVSMAKEAIEDWRRFIQDLKVNARKASVHKGGGVFGRKQWRNIRVGDVVKVEKDKFFPADLLLLSSSYEDGLCYVETMNLDGETNLKVKRSQEVTLPLDSDESFKDFAGVIRCEDPNPSLYTFVGNLEYDRQIYPLDPSQILLRDSKLRNTAYIYGVVIFAGQDSKVMQNSTKSPSKRSSVEKKMDRIIYVLLTTLLAVSIISSMGFFIQTKYQMPDWWYLEPQSPQFCYDPDQAAASGFCHFVTALMLYGYLIPISLYVSIELVKFLQAIFINQDINMYDEESGIPAQARTSNLNEELGQVDTVLSDKTGTLTCNQMDFLKCSIAGTAFGVRASEVEIAAAKQMAIDSEEQESNASSHLGASEIKLERVVTSADAKGLKPSIKGFSFEDSRLMGGNWMKEHNADMILLFLRILAVCHAAIPEVNEETGDFTYEAESPDEIAFLVAAREFGFEFVRRTQSSVFVRERYPSSGNPVEREYKILNLLDFTSKRKRMSVIVRDENGQIMLMCKGADSIIFERLAKNGRMYEESTTRHLNEYGEAGLRTLALAYKPLDEAEYTAWNNEFVKAKTSIGVDREAMLEKVSDMMERELILIGATAVEDKLQKGVPQCIDKLAQAGLKIWVLTGDKMETAINIGFACSLLRQGMKQICILAMNDDSNQDVKKTSLLFVTHQAVKEDISMQITNASQMIKLEKDPHAAFALIIDGKSLAYALEDDMKHQFLRLAVDCASVICCRVSPKQKALVTRLVKEGTGKTTLAIGDGANDVGMIQEADIGVGISGVEGMQAVMASDFAIAQFRFLERLLVVHGHWCYKRITHMICYFFYKNIAFGLTFFYFEAVTGFSGQSIYDDWYMILFNVFVTSIPVISLGVFEQDVSSEICLQFPALYQQGPRNLFFNWHKILGMMFNGLIASVIIFSFNVLLFAEQAFRSGGQTADMAVVGTTMFTCIVWVVNCQIALSMSHFTWFQHIFIWGSIAFWYLSLFIYGMLSPKYTGNVYQILVEILGPSMSYWWIILVVTVTCNLFYFLHISIQRCFFPMDHHIIQEIKYSKRDVQDKRMWTRERSKARQETKIGFTARVEAKIRHLKGRLQKKQSILGTHHAAATAQ
ncbi:probable phospholipid-transporting ATPase 4 isoform X1 [Syzygium oleosum]|uniref:probable phospholipid-transporting ATPase 4 isoform X1 n=1 Tax=Syzygium oleosum TaxID=219896 RepID=UPI0011D2286E|nr:probable phospholipid-transporting ATPase 4 isoform X1 [Syzygium oleosum]